MELCSLAAHLLLCDPVPNRLRTVSGLRPWGLGTPAVEDRMLTSPVLKELTSRVSRQVDRQL